MKQVFLTFLFLGLFLSISAVAGSLEAQPPIVEENQITVPIVLRSTDGVAAADFRFNYDAAQYTPVGVVPGYSALSAGKSVLGNVASDGEYIVVVMGLNQKTMASGEVAQVVLERLPGGGTGAGLRIDKATLATLDGVSLPVQVRNPGDPEPEEEEQSPDAETDPEETPSETDDTTATEEEQAMAQALNLALEQLLGVAEEPDKTPAAPGNVAPNATVKNAGEAQAKLNELLALRGQLPTPGTEEAPEDAAAPGVITANKQSTGSAESEQIEGSTGTEMTVESGNGNTRTADATASSSGTTESKASFPWTIAGLIAIAFFVAMAVFIMRSR